jgi:hypothetical protein
LHFEEGLGWVTKTLCTQNEANAFSIWNNNLRYQGILEFTSKVKWEDQNLIYGTKKL